MKRNPPYILLDIKQVSADEIQDLIYLSQRTFRETFGAQNTEKDIQKYLKENFNQTQLLREVNNENSAFYLARIDQVPIGYLKLNTGDAQTEMNDDSGMEVERWEKLPTRLCCQLQKNPRTCPWVFCFRSLFSGTTKEWRSQTIPPFHLLP